MLMVIFANSTTWYSASGFSVALCWSQAQVKKEGWWRGADTATVTKETTEIQCNVEHNKNMPVWQSPRTLGRTYSRVHHD